MFKEIKTKAELDLLLNNSFSLHKVINKESSKEFFFIKCDKSRDNIIIQDVTLLVNEEDINHTFPLDPDILDYVIENKIIDMKDIDYSNTYGMERIILKYPKVVEFIPKDELDKLLYEEDMYELSYRSALELCASKYFIPKVNKDEVLRELDNDKDFCKDQKEYLKRVIKK